ncbi:MAG: lysylphosphatidylglycerol synthase domain-containing protein [Reichenbachiella sp.]|uniref:lysylphosphatidylglycerol synthase domain-containing protein n=2 Tax=Reichenbachiella sp. TaxID=2184521 RepID=UPI003266B4FB
MIKSLTKRIDTKWIKIAWLAWTWVLPVIILSAVLFKLISTPGKLHLFIGVEGVDWIWLLICMALLPMNIGLEAYKWKAILKPIQAKSIWNSAKIILSGRSLNVISPFGIGDIFAKYMGTTPAQRKQTVGGVIIDRFSQLVPTLTMGVVSVIYLIDKGFSIPLEPLLLAAGIAGALVALTLALVWIYREKIKGYVLLVGSVSPLSFFHIFGSAFLRYGVFTLQFLCVFWWLGSELPMAVLILGIGWIFLIKTVVPNMSVLGDLVKRELSAALFFSFFTDDLGAVMLASFVVWIVNIVMPAVAGLGFVSEMKKTF